MAGCIRCKAQAMEEIMSLLSDAMDECVILNKQTAADGYGGYETTWMEGAKFSAAIVFDTSMEARIGEQQGVKSRYTVTTSRVLNLQYNDYFRRERDGKLFRVTSDGDDRYTPASASLDMRQVEAEEIMSLPK